MRNLLLTGILALFTFSFASTALAADSQTITLKPGWNIVSTPKILESHTFSVSETTENFDIFILDPSQPSGWATMSDLGQSEFIPLFGYFIQNKTGTDQTLTFNYEEHPEPYQQLFDRVFTEPGWYSLGIANSSYAIPAKGLHSDTNNPSNILSLLDGSYNLFIDFTDASYSDDRSSVVLTSPWKAVLPSDINTINDLRETKGYAIYVSGSDARYNGMQGTRSGELEGGKLNIIESSDNPDDGIVQVEDPGDEVTLLVGEMMATNSAVQIQELKATIDPGVTNIQNIASEFVLKINNMVVSTIDASDAISGDPLAAGEPAIYTFADINQFISEGTPIEFSIIAVLNEIGADFSNGEHLSASVSASDIVAMDEFGDSLVTDNLSGAVAGNVISFYSTGIIVEMTNSSTSQVLGLDTTSADDQGKFVVELEVTAIEDTAYIELDAANSTDAVTDGKGVAFSMENSSNQTMTNGITTAVLERISGGSMSGNFARINAGQTVKFRLTVYYDPVATGIYRVQMNEVGYAATATGATAAAVTTPAADFQSESVQVQN